MSVIPSTAFASARFIQISAPLLILVSESRLLPVPLPASLKAKLSRRRHKTALIRSLVRLLPPCIGRSLAYSIDDVIEVVYATRLVAAAAVKLQFPGCENDAGKFRLKWSATAGTKFTKHGNKTLAQLCT